MRRHGHNSVLNEVPLRGLPTSLQTRVLCVFSSLAFVVACDRSEPLTSSTPMAATQTFPTVTRVIDGDTMVEGVGTVRLIAVDTSERAPSFPQIRTSLFTAKN